MPTNSIADYCLILLRSQRDCLRAGQRRFAGKCQPQLPSFRSAQLPTPCRTRAYELQGTVTQEKLLEAPWAQPGYRGAWVSAQPLPAQAAIVAGAGSIGEPESRIRDAPLHVLFKQRLLIPFASLSCVTKCRRT